MSLVFLAAEVALDREVVIKVVRPELLEGLSAERFAREVQFAARLQQANIVPVLTAGTADGMPRYSMPFVRGESLRARLQREGAVPLPEAVNILRDVARALAYTHGDGVIHRDIKPDNILLSGGTAVVADFGIAKATRAARTASTGFDTDTSHGETAVTHVGMSVGTPAYMAPEQALGDPTTDHRADIYAWGVVAYELLSGAHPFAGRSTLQALIAAHIGEVPSAFAATSRQIPPALQALVMRALAKEPLERPGSAAELVQALDALTTPTRVGGPASTIVSAPPARKQWRIIAAAVACVVALGAWWFVSRSPDARGLASTSSAASRNDTLRSIVVMPFENLGPAADAYFADGLAEEIGTRLGQIPGMRVVGRASAARFRDRSDRSRKSRANWALSMCCAAACDGIVQVAAKAPTRRSALVQRSFGPRVVSSSGVSRSPKSSPMSSRCGPMSLSASPPLSPCEWHRQRAPRCAAPIRRIRQRAMRSCSDGVLSPNAVRPISRPRSSSLRARSRWTRTTRAWAGLAEAQAVAPTYGVPMRTSGVEAARHAIGLDSLSAEAWTSYAAALTYEVRLREALATADRAVALDASSPAAQSRRGMLLLDVGRIDEAETPLRLAVQLDPYVSPYVARLAGLHAARGNADSMLATARLVAALDPSNRTVQRFAAGLLAQLDRVPDAIETCSSTGEPRDSCKATFETLTDPNRRAAALSMLAAPERANPSSLLRVRTFRAAAYAHLGDKDAAFAMLADVFRNGREAALFTMINSPWLQTLKTDPRWQSIVVAGQR
jgi:serine/threonine-protein kinase